MTTNRHLRALATYLFVSDLDASLDFYQALGLNIEKVGPGFGRAFVGDTLVLELGTAGLTASYDANYVAPEKTSKGTLNFELGSAQAVDALFYQLLDLGYEPHLAPIDAPWQARFAIVLDPDGNQVGLHSPRSLEEDRQREG